MLCEFQIWYTQNTPSYGKQNFLPAKLPRFSGPREVMYLAGRLTLHEKTDIFNVLLYIIPLYNAIIMFNGGANVYISTVIIIMT